MSKRQGKNASPESRPLRPAQRQSRQPGIESAMRPRPVSITKSHHGSGRLAGRVALITGGDSGIGRAVALAFAREGADVCVAYLNEHADAAETRRGIEAEGRKALLIPCDIRDDQACARAVDRCVSRLGSLSILVNNAAVQFPEQSIADIKRANLLDTFATNIFSMFFFGAAALPHLRKSKGVIINTTSVTAYRGSEHLVDYAATKGAIVAFTRSLALQLVQDGIRVNAVAPGPIWTPLIPATFPKTKVAEFGSDVPMRRAGQPADVAPAYVYLASNESSYMTGQVLHVNGGEIING